MAKNTEVSFLDSRGFVYATARDAETAFDLWRRGRWNVLIDGALFDKKDWRGREAIEKLFGQSYRMGSMNKIAVAEELVKIAKSLIGTAGVRRVFTPLSVKKRLEYLRGEIEAERISYGEIAELESLVKYIDPGDVLLLEWAGVPETGRRRGV